MNVFGFGFLVMVSLVGGLIAVFADNLGRTLGKKRLTFLKMRPRKTAQVFTFTAGALIPLLSVGAVFWLSADVRRWFAEGPRIVDERDRLSGEVKELASTRSQLDGEIQRLQTSAKGLTTQITDLQGQLKANQVRLADLTKRKAEVEGRVKILDGRIRSLDAKIAQTQKDLLAAQKAIEGKEHEFGLLTRQTDILQKQFNLLNADLKSSYDENERLYDENEKLTGSITKLNETRIDLEGKIRAAETKLSEVEANYAKQLGTLERELERVRIDRDDIKSQIQNAQTVLQQILKTTTDISGGSRTQPVMYQMGEEIARIQVPAGLSPEDAANELSRLLRAARAEAEDHGAKPRDSVASANIVERVIEGRLVSPEDQMKSIVNRLTGLSDDLVLVATSSLNAFVGEPVSIEIQSFRNPIVFEEGTMVAEGRVEGDRPEEIIVAQISEFVTKQIRDLARSKGMVPTLGQEERYGMLPQNTLIELMRSARANDRRVRIQAFAPKDIRAGDPLTLEFRIR